MFGLIALGIKETTPDKNYCSKKTFERARSIAENAQYKDNDEIIDWYVTILVLQMDKSNLVNVRFTFEKMTEIATTRPHIMEDDFFPEEYSRIKQLLKDAEKTDMITGF